MAVTVKKVVLWRRDVDNRPGALARILEPLAGTGADLQVAMGYRIPGQEERAVIELAPVTGREGTGAAQDAGLAPSNIPTLVAQGENRPGLGAAQARALADGGINIAFLVAQVIGPRYTAIYGFESQSDADRAAALLKSVSVAPARGARPAARRKAAPRKKAAGRKASRAGARRPASKSRGRAAGRGRSRPARKR